LTRIAGPDKIILSWQNAAIGPDMLVLQRTEGFGVPTDRNHRWVSDESSGYVFDNVIAYFKQFTGDGKKS